MSGQQKTERKKQKIIGNYELGKVIGTGTFAHVREAVHLPTQEKAAIKILSKRLIVDARDKMNVSRQISILRKVRHPYIAQLLQTMETKSKIYLVMQYVSGGELYQSIVQGKKGRLGEKTAIFYFLQLLEAVEYLHSLGITHRDIKPQNILIDTDNCIKIIDFGLGNYYQPKQRLNTACGSPCYAAPEMLSHSNYSPKQAEIWSCGIVLYTMLCGFLPFQHESTSQLYKMVATEKYEQPQHLSHEAKSLLSSIIKANPKQRLSFKQIRQHPICKNKRSLAKGLSPSESLRLQDQIVEKMKSMGMHGFTKDIQQHKNNSNTACYFLLLFKMVKDLKLPLATYYLKLMQTSSPFRSKSIIIRQYDSANPQFQKNTLGRNSISLVRLSDQEQNIFFDKLQSESRKVKKSSSVRIKIMK